MGIVKYIYQDTNYKSPSFSNIKDVSTVFSCYPICPPEPPTPRNWLPMLHYYGDDEPLSWSTWDDEFFKWTTPMFYNITGREVYIDWGDGSEVEKSSAVVVKHNYTESGTYTPYISFDSDEQPDYFYYYQNEIICPILCDLDDTFISTPTRFESYYNQQENNSKWELIIDNDVISNSKPFYIFTNDENCDFEWRYYSKPDDYYYSPFTLYMSESPNTLNRTPFFAYKPGEKREPINYSTVIDFKRDDTCLLIDGTGKTRVEDVVYKSYGEVLTYGFGKQIKFNNCSDVLNRDEDGKVQLKLTIDSRLNLSSGYNIKVYCGNNIETEIFNGTVDYSGVVFDELIDYNDSYTVTIFINTRYDDNNNEISCEITTDETTGKINGMSLRRTWL